jgi:aryl-alcohol dehydrogenase (NADP+)
MQYRKLGRSGIFVSPICLGTMMFGGQTEEATAARIVASARDAGVNFIDTSDTYNLGQSEMIVGRAIAADRSRWILATKVGNKMDAGPNGVGLSRRRIIEECEQSLRRLGTDTIDIYYLHREDPNTPLGETVRAMADLARAGKIRYFGVSNYRGWRIAEIVAICDRLGVDRPVVSQPYYNALNRLPEVEHLPACNYYGLGVVPYSPLARGVLTAKYDPALPPPPDTRAGRRDARMMETEWRAESLDIAQTIRRHAERRGGKAADFAIAWLLNDRSVSAIVAGPRTEDQWRDYLAALDYRFDSDDEALLDSLVAPGHASTPGYNDPRYALEGRRPYTASRTSQWPVTSS